MLHFAHQLNVARALIGFLLTVTPISMEMMGWRGAASGPGIVGGASVLVALVQSIRCSSGY